MRQTHRTHRPSGFTLIELLVVVIILAILAAIVIPQFSSATTDTQEAALDSNLGGMRNAIELYKAQHTTFPGGTATSGGPTCTGGTVGVALINTPAAVSDHLLAYSNAAGATCTLGDAAVYKFGPYLRKGIPADPITQVAAIVVTSAGTPLVPTVTTGGWAYDTRSGQIVMNSKTKDSRDKEYYTH